MDLTSSFFEESRRQGFSQVEHLEMDKGLEIYIRSAQRTFDSLVMVETDIKKYISCKSDQYLEEKEEYLNQAEEEFT